MAKNPIAPYPKRFLWVNIVLCPYINFLEPFNHFNTLTNPDPHFSHTVHWWDFPIDSESWSEGLEATNRYHIPKLDGKLLVEGFKRDFLIWLPIYCYTVLILNFHLTFWSLNFFSNLQMNLWIVWIACSILISPNQLYTYTNSYNLPIGLFKSFYVYH